LIHFQTTKLIRLFSSRRNIYVDDLNGLYHSCPAHAFVLAVDALALLLSPGLLYLGIIPQDTFNWLMKTSQIILS
jgi:hypothetical protein